MERSWHLRGRALLGTPLQTISAKATITHSLAIERGDELVYALLRASYLRAGDAYRIAGCGGKVRTQGHRLRQDRAAIRCLFNSKREGAGARDGDPARDPDRDAGDARVHRPKLPASPACPLDDPFAFAELQAFNSYLCSTLHVA